MSHIGEYVSISATNAGAIIDALTAQLREAQSMKDYYCGQVVQLTAETEAQAAEIKRLQGELEVKNARPEEPAHKFKVGDRVRVRSDLVEWQNYGSGLGQIGLLDTMALKKGSEATVVDISSHGNCILDIGYVWHPSMLETAEAPDAALS